jgi:galactokinase
MPSDPRIDRLLERLGVRSGDAGLRLWRAPGRVNVIGEHVDYAGGKVLPFACNLDVMLACVPDADEVVLDSLDVPGRARVRLDGAGEAPTGWGRYAAGVVEAAREAGLAVRGVRGVLGSTVPVGAGLSSSAALEAAVALAVLDGEQPPARVLQRAEHIAVGVPCGVMDQVAALHGRAGHAIALDCATVTWELVPLPAGLGFVVVDTGTRRALEDGRYAQRRREAERGQARRIRHVETEMARVDRAIDALRDGELAVLGALLDASHASLREDFEVSSDALDAAVAACRTHDGCLGARLVGAGFAGCVLAAVRAGAEADVGAHAAARLRAAGFGRAVAYPVRAADGAGPVSAP